MIVFPEHMDTHAAAKLKKGQIPLYTMLHTIPGTTTMHHHEYVEFSYAVEGTGIETINGKSFDVKPGTVRFLLPHQMHKITSSADNTIKLFCFMFDFSILYESKTDHQLCKLLLQAGNNLPSYNYLKGREQVEMQRLCESMLEEYKGNAFGKDSSIRAKLIEALLQYVRSFPHSPLEAIATQPQEPKQSDWEIIHYMNANYLNSIKLKDLSERFGYSTSYISTMMQRNLGHSFLEYLHILRMKRAYSLLMSSDMSIYQIAVEAGFESFRTFSRLFMEMTKMTPSEFKQSYKNPNPPSTPQ